MAKVRFSEYIKKRKNSQTANGTTKNIINALATIYEDIDRCSTQTEQVKVITELLELDKREQKILHRIYLNYHKYCKANGMEEDDR